LECVVRKFDAPRILMEGAYLLLYETHPDTDDGSIDSVEIVRVVNGRRDLTSSSKWVEPYLRRG
jgi:hypothetical protein